MRVKAGEKNNNLFKPANIWKWRNDDGISTN